MKQIVIRVTRKTKFDVSKDWRCSVMIISPQMDETFGITENTESYIHRRKMPFLWYVILWYRTVECYSGHANCMSIGVQCGSLPQHTKVCYLSLMRCCLSSHGGCAPLAQSPQPTSRKRIIQGSDTSNPISDPLLSLFYGHKTVWKLAH